MGIRTKTSRHDFVTAADDASEEAIIKHILSLRPNDTILAEETGRREGTSGVRWLIDPLDGTMNFVYGRREYAVSVAAEVEGEPVVGAICRPWFNDWIVAGPGVARGSSGRPVVRTPAGLGEALIAVHLPLSHARRLLHFELLRQLLFVARDFRSTGSIASDLFAVATGMLDAYVGIQNMPWDLGAGMVLVRAAGGVGFTTQTAGGREAVIIGAPAVVADLIPFIEELRDLPI